jgi:hypothetical protein
MKPVKTAGPSLTVTVNGKIKAALLDPPTYQGVAGQLGTVASIRRGLAQARKGAGRPADEVFEHLERKTRS